MEEYPGNSISEPKSNVEHNSKTDTTLDNLTVHSECLKALAKDIGVNIKELFSAIARDQGIDFDEQQAQAAAAVGENVYIESVRAGKSFSISEIVAFKTALPNKEWSCEGIWKKQLEKEINEALDCYCSSGSCKRFIK